MLDAKRALRARVLSARDQMPAAARVEASRAIVTALVARADFQAAPTLLLTLPFGSEWDTAPLFAVAIGRNKVVALPRVNLATRMLELCAITDLGRDVAPGYHGIREPLPHCVDVAPAAIMWVLVPGVAFDRNGKRLGYGGGFYDRLLPSLSPAAARVAGAFELQIVDDIPAAAHDLAVDAIVTEVRTLSPAR
jgi:5-formyltetrahydrofolate cyclo-ligase